MQIRIQIMPFHTIESNRSYSLRLGLLLYLFFLLHSPLNQHSVLAQIRISPPQGTEPEAY